MLLSHLAMMDYGTTTPTIVTKTMLKQILPYREVHLQSSIGKWIELHGLRSLKNSVIPESRFLLIT